MRSFVLIFFMLLLTMGPQVVDAAIFDIWEGTGSGGATCNISVKPDGTPNAPCTFCDALTAVFNIINSLMTLVVPLAVIMIVYGAIRLIIAGGSEDSVKKGKDAITSAVIGIIIALASWIIVNTILHILTGHPNLPWNELQCS